MTVAFIVPTVILPARPFSLTRVAVVNALAEVQGTQRKYRSGLPLEHLLATLAPHGDSDGDQTLRF